MASCTRVEQWASRRDLKKSSLHEQTSALGAVYYQARVWERPQWYTSNADLVERYGLSEREVEWDRRWWSPIIDAEHLNMRENAGVVDLSAFQIFDLSGPGAIAFCEYLAVNKVDKPVGSSTYTPWLNRDGGFHSDLTMLRIADETVRVVTGAFDGGRDEAWIKKFMPRDGSVTFTNRTQDFVTIGLWGPKAPAILGSLTDADLTQTGSPYGSIRTISAAGVSCDIFRISYVGDTGWEIYVAWNDAPKLYEALLAAGADHGLRPTGAGVYALTGRVEKGYRLMGAELESEYNPLEAGLARPKVKSEDFIGKAAYLAAREAGPAATMCTFTVDDNTDSQGRKRYMQGGNEPILTVDGNRIVDSHGRVSRVTTAAGGPSVGKHLLLGYLPTELAVVGATFKVMYMNELFPITVAATTGSVFDPEDARLKS